MTRPPLPFVSDGPDIQGATFDNKAGNVTFGQIPQRTHDAVSRLIAIESELREQAIGSQDGYLLDIANRIRGVISAIK